MGLDKLKEEDAISNTSEVLPVFESWLECPDNGW